jgi:hypothetical protein
VAPEVEALHEVDHAVLVVGVLLGCLVPGYGVWND